MNVAPVSANGVVAASVILYTNNAGDSLGRNAFNVKYVSREVRSLGGMSGVVGWRVQLADVILFGVDGEKVDPGVGFLACDHQVVFNGNDTLNGNNLISGAVCQIDEDSGSPGDGPVFWFAVFDVANQAWVAPADAISAFGDFQIHISWTQAGIATPPFDPAFPP